MKKLLLVFLLVASAFGAISGYKHFTPDGAGTKSGADWDNAYPVDSLGAVLANMVEGTVVFIKAGSYSFTSTNITTANASDSNPNGIFGVKAATTNTGASITASDLAVDTVDMPDIDLGSRNLALGTHSKLYCCKLRGTASYIFYLASGGYQTVYNCVFRNSSATAANYVATISQNSNIVKNIFISTGGCGGINGGGTARFFSNRIIGNRVTGTKGANINAHSAFVGNIITGFHVGVNVPSGNSYPCIVNNTIYACSTGIAFAGTSQNQYRGSLIMNNLLDSCYTDGIKMGRQRDVVTFISNHGDDARCTDMWDNVEESTIWRDYLVTTGDPKFVNPPDSLQLGSDSPARNTGIGPR